MDNFFSVIDVARLEVCCQGSYGEMGFIILVVILAEGNAEQTSEDTYGQVLSRKHARHLMIPTGTFLK